MSVVDGSCSDSSDDEEYVPPGILVSYIFKSFADHEEESSSESEDEISEFVMFNYLIFCLAMI